MYLIPAGFGAFALVIGAIVFLRVMFKDDPSGDHALLGLLGGAVSLIFAGIMLIVTFNWYRFLHKG